MVHADDPGFAIGPGEKKLGIRGSPTNDLYFDNCRIPSERIIGEPGTGFKTAMRTLDQTRPTIGAQAVGLVAMQVTTDAVQLLGGAGYTRDFPVERMMRDAKITQIYEGTNQILRVVMSSYFDLKKSGSGL